MTYKYIFTNVEIGLILISRYKNIELKKLNFDLHSVH